MAGFVFRSLRKAFHRGFRATSDPHRRCWSSASPGLSAMRPQAPDVPTDADSESGSPDSVDRPIHRIESMTGVAWSPLAQGPGRDGRGRSQAGVPKPGSGAVSRCPFGAGDRSPGAQSETTAHGEPSVAGIVSMSSAHGLIPSGEPPSGGQWGPNPARSGFAPPAGRFGSDCTRRGQHGQDASSAEVIESSPRVHGPMPKPSGSHGMAGSPVASGPGPVGTDALACRML